ncbi:hypothetical protein SETIT_7G229100v2 [Setaria italica]|uniref:Uncharacterized protein n=1 Tax=Setaria italica TaxID=4555 RepID=A0A368RYM7_SETIT|nr:hypothetical protein SETIT_7G229100v2 [Setaria italica]
MDLLSSLFLSPFLVKLEHAAGRRDCGSGKRRNQSRQRPPAARVFGWSEPAGSEGTGTRRRPDVRGRGGARKGAQQGIDGSSYQKRGDSQIPDSLPMNPLSQIGTAATV